MVDMPRSAAGALWGVGGLRAGTTARSDAEQRASDARVRAVVRRIEARDQAGDVLTDRLAAEPQQAGRGTELEEQRLPRGGDRDRPGRDTRRWSVTSLCRRHSPRRAA